MSSDISSNSGQFKALDEAIAQNTSALVVSFDEQSGLLTSEKAGWWMRTRSGLLRAVRWFGVDSKNFWLKPQDKNQASLKALLDYIEQQGGESVRQHVLDGTARLNGDAKGSNYTIADRLTRGSYVSSGLVKQMKELAEGSPQMQRRNMSIMSRHRPSYQHDVIPPTDDQVETQVVSDNDDTKELAEGSPQMQRRNTLSFVSRKRGSSDQHDEVPPTNDTDDTDDQVETQNVSDNDDTDEPAADSNTPAPDLNTNRENQDSSNSPFLAPVTPPTSQSTETKNSANNDHAQDPPPEEENSTSEHISNTNTLAKPTSHVSGDSPGLGGSNEDVGLNESDFKGVTFALNPRTGSTFRRQLSTDFDNLPIYGSHKDTNSSALTPDQPSMLRPSPERASHRAPIHSRNRSQLSRLEKGAAKDDMPQDMQDMNWTKEITTFDFNSAKTVALEQIGTLSEKDKKAFDEALQKTIARIEKKYNSNDGGLRALRREVLKLVKTWQGKSIS